MTSGLATIQNITGPGPWLGQHGHEGIPVQFVAAIVGVGSSFDFTASHAERFHGPVGWSMARLNF
jgi:hypothetical protein